MLWNLSYEWRAKSNGQTKAKATLWSIKDHKSERDTLLLDLNNTEACEHMRSLHHGSGTFHYGCYTFWWDHLLSYSIMNLTWKYIQKMFLMYFLLLTVHMENLRLWTSICYSKVWCNLPFKVVNYSDTTALQK